MTCARTPAICLLVLATVAMALFALKRFTKGDGQAAPDSPQLQCNRSVNVGSRQIDEVVKTDVVLTNVGGRPLVISRIAKNCGCLNATILGETSPDQNDTTIIPPGGSSVLRVSFQVRQERVHTPLIVSFRTNDESNPFCEIAFSVQSILGLNFSPNVVLGGDLFAL